MFYTQSGIKSKDCILKHHKRYKRLLVGHIICWSVSLMVATDQLSITCWSEIVI